MRNIQFVNEGIYHIYNRGVDKRSIFMNGIDRKRFLFSLIKFNDTQHSTNQTKLSRTIRSPIPTNTPYVDILAFCMMTNHFHLLVKQKSTNGISEYMQRLSCSYTKYFNLTHGRSGRLFEGPYKVKHVNNDIYFEWLIQYIHINPLTLIKFFNQENYLQMAMRFLDSYKWSSHRTYSNIEDLPFIMKDEINKFLPNPKNYTDYLSESIMSKAWLWTINVENQKDGKSTPV